MGINFLKASIALLLLFPTRGNCLEPVEALTRSYGIFWGGMNVADAILDIKNSNDTYTIRLFIESRGLARRISKYRCAVKTEVIVKGDQYTPIFHQAIFELRKKRREIKISYDKDGNIKSEESIPPENRAKRPEVSKELKDKILDPLTAGILSRNLASIGNDFKIPIYDGRRRTDLEFKLEEKTHMSFVMTPVAGHTNNELNDKAYKDLRIHVYFDDKDFLPVKLEGKSSLGFVVGRLEETCKTIDECLPQDMKKAWEKDSKIIE